jgi:exosortase
LITPADNLTGESMISDLVLNQNGSQAAGSGADPAGQADRKPFLAEVAEAGREISRWPVAAKLFAVALLALYVPVIWTAAKEWISQENYAHGMFIFPISLALLWMGRADLRKAQASPTAMGLFPLALGLLMQVAGFILSFSFLAILSIIPLLYGAVLALHGRNLLRAVQFPLLFVFFAAPTPAFVLVPISTWLQRVCSSSAVTAMKGIGYTIAQAGNIIEVPGASLEVADACSGLKKLVAMVAFAALYGYMFRVSPAKRVVLLLASIPIALLANVARICGLIAVSSAGGVSALHVAHDWAELFVLVVAFFLFVGFGKLIGCKTLRFSEP